MSRVVVFSGVGHHADPWHPFAETSAAVAALVREAGHEVVVRESEPGSLVDVAEFDLLVVNSGGRGGDVTTAAWRADHAALAAFGGPVLGLHIAVATFPEWPAWSGIIGGRWGRDAFHPDIDVATFVPAAGAGQHPLWEGLESVSVFDERYCNLEVLDGSVPIIQHETDGRVHTVGWIANGPVVYDGLGHDARSYESRDRQKLLLNEVRWLLDPAREPLH